MEHRGSIDEYSILVYSKTGFYIQGTRGPRLDDITHAEAYRRFLQHLKLARQEAGLIQEQVAEALGKPQPFVSKMESGERRLDIVELEEIAELYGKPLAYFKAFRPNPGSS